MVFLVCYCDAEGTVIFCTTKVQKIFTWHLSGNSVSYKQLKNLAESHHKCTFVITGLVKENYFSIILKAAKMTFPCIPSVAYKDMLYHQVEHFLI